MWEVSGKGKEGEKERKGNSITSVRKFGRETIAVYSAAKMTGNAGKEPAPLKEKKAAKPKKATKAQLEEALAAQAAENERLLAELAALKAGNSADK